MTEYKYKTKPLEHQAKLFEETRDMEYFACFWEQGTGKTKPALDTAAYLFETGKIDCLYVVSPGCVTHNWTVKELAKHMPDRVQRQVKAFAYSSPKAGTKRHAKEAQEVIDHKGFSIVAQSYDGFRTKKGLKFARKLLETRRCLYILDESARIKTPSSKRAISVIASGKYAPYRRILTGTPVANGPLDVYSQMRFLEPNFWKPHGLDSFTAFKNYFAVWKTQELDKNGSFPILLEYQNLEELHDILSASSSRVTKDQVLDLPPKIYTRVYFDMSSKQSKLYKELKRDYITSLDSGEVVAAELGIVRMLRLQQITCGYVATTSVEPHPDDPDFDVVVEQVTDIDQSNTRLKTLIDVISDIPDKVIIWARFTRDVDLICDYLGDRAVRYDGKVNTEDRLKAIESFEEGMHKNAQFFVAKASSAGEGITLVQAKTVIYYNNTFKLNDREQSEDRAHRFGQDRSVLYIDISARGTIDDHLIDSLRSKKNIARIITGDAVKEWL